jgi:hypothetical protein
VAGAWVVGENPRLLFFPHIKPQTRYVVRVQPGLPARNGSKLDEEARFSIITAAVAPAFYFASRGMVLPAAQNGGLPVTTVNVPEVDIQFLKVKPDQLASFLEKVISRTVAFAGSRGQDEESDSEVGRPLLQPRYAPAGRGQQLGPRSTAGDDQQCLHRPLRHRAEGESSQRHLHSGREHSGAARAGCLRGGDVATQPFPLRLPDHLLLRQRPRPASAAVPSRGADAYVSSLTDGKARAGVEVSWIDAQGKTLASGETDRDGRSSPSPSGPRARVW